MVTATQSAHERELSGRDTEKRPSGSKIDFPIQSSAEPMTVEARV